MYHCAGELLCDTCGERALDDPNGREDIPADCRACGWRGSLADLIEPDESIGGTVNAECWYECPECERENVALEPDGERFPVYVDEDYSETDFPSHCGQGERCPHAEELPDGGRVGALLHENLTDEGRAYVAKAILEGGTVAREIWADAFGFREEYRAVFHAHCGITWDLDDDDDRTTVRNSVAAYLREKRREGRTVNVLEPGERWEIEEPDDCIMIPDDAGTLVLRHTVRD